MRKLHSLGFLVAGAALMLACGASGSVTPESEVNRLVEIQIKLSDGRNLTCVGWPRSEVNGGGLDCDWERANRGL